MDKRSPRPYLVAMIQFGDFDLPYSLHAHSDAFASSPIAYSAADRAVQCAIPIPGAWGRGVRNRSRNDMLQTVMDRVLKPDELVWQQGIVAEYGRIRSTQILFST